jgi:hypothetical protein
MCTVKLQQQHVLAACQITIDMHHYPSSIASNGGADAPERMERAPPQELRQADDRGTFIPAQMSIAAASQSPQQYNSSAAHRQQLMRSDSQR